MFKYIPDQVPDAAPLIVVMHGCRQNARTFARESGWIHLADKLHLALAMPEQTQANNLSNCFNWFEPNNIMRDQGEAMSIKQMVDKMKSDHNIDPKRIYVTGLSAGGAKRRSCLQPIRTCSRAAALWLAYLTDAQKTYPTHYSV